MTSIVITDLTRFSKGDKVCTAGTDLETGLCIRPMPYIPMSDCEKLSILPGSILSGDFSDVGNKTGPHQEDMQRGKLIFHGPSTPEQFREALEANLYDSVEDGFNISLTARQKHIPLDHELDRSIITIKVSPEDVEVVEDSYNKGKLKIHFKDQSGRSFSFMSITDLGFNKYASDEFSKGKLNDLNDFIQQQEEVYLRVGLSRSWDNGTNEGYWIQINGVYTFPEFFEELRMYK